MDHDYSQECPDGPCMGCVTRVARKNRRVWRLRQLLPLTYRTTYRTLDGREHFAVWRMFLGKVFDHSEVTIAR